MSHDRFPQRKGHPLIDDSFLSLTWAAELNSKKAGSQGAQKQAQWIEQGAGRLLFEVLRLYFLFISRIDAQCYHKSSSLL